MRITYVEKNYEKEEKKKIKNVSAHVGARGTVRPVRSLGATAL
jgi:hypothetical protein